jgi:hypothetical protein
MREKLWNLLDKTRFEYEDWQQYRQYLEKRRKVLAITVAIMSFVIVNLSLSFNSLSAVWSLSLIVCGLVALLSDKMGYESRLFALRYYLPAMDEKLNAFHDDWLRVQTADVCDDELREMFKKYMDGFTALSNKYLEGIHFPIHKRSKAAAGEFTKYWAERLS